MAGGNEERDEERKPSIDSGGAVDSGVWDSFPSGDEVDVQEAIDSIVKEELAKLANATAEEQESSLPGLMERVESRALTTLESQGKKGYQFGDITKSVVETTRGEVQRQIDAEWNMDDISLLLKVGLFLGATAAAPAAGLAALPAAALLATYGTVLKAELGVRAVSEVGSRMTERAAQGVADGVKAYTGKDSYEFGDVTTASVRKLTGNDDYQFGDLTKGAIKSVTGGDEYQFGDITKNAVKGMTGKDAGEYKFGDITKNLMKSWKTGNEKEPEETRQQPGQDSKGGDNQKKT